MATEFTHDYPLAKGRMAQVWAQCVCPVCDSELEHVADNYRDQLHMDVYQCLYCRNLVIYISPAKYGEYREVPANERWYCVDDF